ncbi:hypothetical protein NBRC3293_2158 [Gluconobacter oxydans NBRC 3293]|uniref:Uncharacterized protein n=1 Tax=Gluconobacter oxydans NBRC 3293 TaxID=1315969 RepID=A0A829WY33_GLUOY|nr:hypothetical protein NBRC3293_2158 [Gluconobacter oxydans NBRC 3293]
MSKGTGPVLGKDNFHKPALVICFRACEDALNKRYEEASAGLDEPPGQH